MKSEFSASLLQSSVSHDLQKSFKYTDLLLNYYYFFGYIMFKTVMLLNDFTVFTVTFDQLNQWFPNWGAEL